MIARPVRILALTLSGALIDDASFGDNPCL